MEGLPVSRSAAVQRWPKLSTIWPCRLRSRGRTRSPANRPESLGSVSEPGSPLPLLILSRRRDAASVLRVKTPGRATAAVQCSALPRTPHNAHIGHHPRLLCASPMPRRPAGKIIRHLVHRQKADAGMAVHVLVQPLEHHQHMWPAGYVRMRSGARSERPASSINGSASWSAPVGLARPIPGDEHPSADALEGAGIGDDKDRPSAVDHQIVRTKPGRAVRAVPLNKPAVRNV